MARYYGVPLRNGLPIGLGSAISLRKPGGAAAAVPDPYFEYTTLLLPGNGTNGAQNNTFLDSSANAFSITRNGNTTQGSFSPFSQTGWSNYFDGSGDYLTSPNNAAIQLNNSTAFTLECWFNAAAFANQNIFRRIAGSAPFAGYGLATGEGGAATNTLVFWDGSAWRTVLAGLVAGQWYHFAATYEGSGTTLRFFVNGIQQGSALTCPAGISNTADTFAIGAANAGTAPFTGYVSNLRIVKGTAVYTSNFTVPTTPLTAITNTSLLTCQANRFLDASSNNFTITRNGDVSVQAFSPFNPTAAWSAATNGGSGYFDGSGDFLSTTTNIAAIGTGDFTLEVWCYPTATTSYRYFLAIGPDTNFATGLNTGGYAPYLYAGSFILTSSISTVPNAWNHVQYVRSSGTLTVYVNGVSGGSVTWTGSIAAGRGYIGANDSNLYYFFGYHSSLRFSNIARSVSVPTAPYTSDANTQLLLNYTNAGIYDATSKNDLETVGNAQISTTQSKFGGSSMYFDGTGDWLNGPSTQNFNLSTSDWTIEGWYYPTNYSVGNNVILLVGASGADKIVIATLGTSGHLNYLLNGSVVISTTSAGAINSWSHFALVRSGSTTTLYLNGTSIGTTASTPTSSSKLIQVGTDGGGAPYVGYLQDIRLTKGYARYTANFTPPTSAFPLL